MAIDDEVFGEEDPNNTLDFNLTQKTLNQSQMGVVQITIRNEKPLSKMKKYPKLQSCSEDNFCNYNQADGSNSSIIKGPRQSNNYDSNNSVEFALQNSYEIKNVEIRDSILSKQPCFPEIQEETDFLIQGAPPVASSQAALQLVEVAMSEKAIPDEIFKDKIRGVVHIDPA